MDDKELDTSKNMSFEQAMTDLEGVVRELEEGSLKLTEALQRYEQGLNLLGTCQELLADFELKVQEIDERNKLSSHGSQSASNA